MHTLGSWQVKHQIGAIVKVVIQTRRSALMICEVVRFQFKFKGRIVFGNRSYVDYERKKGIDDDYIFGLERLEEWNCQ